MTQAPQSPISRGHHGWAVMMPSARRARGVRLMLALAVLAALVGLAAAAPRPAAAQTPPCANGVVVPSPSLRDALVADCAVLLALRDELRGTAALNWSAAEPLASWDGVSVGRATPSAAQRVRRLELDGLGLDGTIPAGLGELSALAVLRLAWNRLSGPIPAGLGDLHELTELVLGGNRLSGPIPAELGAIGPALGTLHLSGPAPLPAGVD